MEDDDVRRFLKNTFPELLRITREYINELDAMKELLPEGHESQLEDAPNAVVLFAQHWENARELRDSLRSMGDLDGFFDALVKKYRYLTQGTPMFAAFKLLRDKQDDNAKRLSLIVDGWIETVRGGGVMEVPIPGNCREELSQLQKIANAFNTSLHAFMDDVIFRLANPSKTFGPA